MCCGCVNLILLPINLYSVIVNLNAYTILVQIIFAAEVLHSLCFLLFALQIALFYVALLAGFLQRFPFSFTQVWTIMTVHLVYFD